MQFCEFNIPYFTDYRSMGTIGRIAAFRLNFCVIDVWLYKPLLTKNKLKNKILFNLIFIIISFMTHKNSVIYLPKNIGSYSHKRLTKMKQLQNFILQTFRSLFVVYTTEHLDTRTSKKTLSHCN
jgi:hypothetical protein